MLMDITDDVQSKVFEPNSQTLQEKYQAIQTECSVLRQHYQTLYENFQTLFKSSPLKQGYNPDRAANRQALHSYCQSLQEQRRVIQHFRHTLHTHLMSTRSYRSNVNSGIPTGRSLIRKTILLGVGNEQDAALLMEGMRQTGAHRVFLATDSSQVLCILQNIHIDVLVLDDELNELPARKLYYHLCARKELKTLPVIIMYACFTSLLQEERVHTHLIGLEKPITGEELVGVIDQLLV